MPERPGTVWLFGKEYRWHKRPGHGVELVPFVPLPEPPPPSPADLYEETVRMMGGPLPWPEGAIDG